MAKALKQSEIMENLELLSDWLRVKYPDQHFEMVMAGGAAMALQGFKDQTIDIDLFSPRVLPEPVLKGIDHISRVKRLGPEWLNTQLAVMLGKAVGFRRLPDYFKEIARTIEIGNNLKIDLIGRQALISLKMYAVTPSYNKHTLDIINLNPARGEIIEAVRFVMDIDATKPRKDDLRIVLKTLGFDFDEIYKSI